MDKILSARVDESVLLCITSLARRLNTSKKKIIENAIRMYANKIDQQENQDVFELTNGVWQREESPSQIADKARKTFRKSMERPKS